MPLGGGGGILFVKTETTGLCRVHAALRSPRLGLIIYLTSKKPEKQYQIIGSAPIS